MSNSVHINTSTHLKDYMEPFLGGLLECPAPKNDYSACKVVVVGGGTGAPLSIRVLRSLGITPNAVVAMADDGASTGRLRAETGATAPGDVRKCLLALAKDPAGPVVRAFGYRLGCANDHALGNLILTAFEESTSSFIDSLELCEEMLHVVGHTYPSTLDSVVLHANDGNGKYFNSQASADEAECALKHMWLECDKRKGLPRAYEPALQALQEADVIVVGPGSLFTSIGANLAVPGIAQALSDSKAKVVFVGPACKAQAEAVGMTVSDQINALFELGLERVDFAVVNDSGEDSQDFQQPLTAADKAFFDERSIRIISRDFKSEINPEWHNPVMLRSAFEEVLQACHLPAK